MNNHNKSILKYALVSLIFYALLEATSFVGLHTFQVLRPEHFTNTFVDEHFDSISEDERRGFLRSAYNQALGWEPKPFQELRLKNTINQAYTITFDGEASRKDDLPSKELLIATYGDSFTLCQEVEDHQTWQYFLESRIGYEVKNFGVGAYGTGQAVLRMKKHFSQGKVAPITILGIWEENINRVGNSFRPFYQPSTNVKLGFKPYFRLGKNGQARMFPNPYQESGASLEDLRQLAKRHAKKSFWVTESKKIEIKYPFSFQFFLAVELFASRKYQSWIGANLPWWWEVDLWETEEGRAVMYHLVEKFVALTTKAQSRPMLLFIPSGNSLRQNNAARYLKFKKEIALRYPNLKILDVMDLSFEKERFNIQAYSGHVSPYGNEVIARGIERIYLEHFQRVLAPNAELRS